MLINNFLNLQQHVQATGGGIEVCNQLKLATRGTKTASTLVSEAIEFKETSDGQPLDDAIMRGMLFKLAKACHVKVHLYLFGRPMYTFCGNLSNHMHVYVCMCVHILEGWSAH